MRTCVNVYGDESGGPNTGVDGVSACFPAPLCSFKRKRSSAHLDDLSTATLSHLDRVLSGAALRTTYRASPPIPCSDAAIGPCAEAPPHITCHPNGPKRYDAPFVLYTPSP